MVRIDSRLVASVVANLVENASKYAPARSTITLQGWIDGHTLTIGVRDQGPGIPADELSRVFDKFYRGASGPVKRRDGTGMGLAIARGIIEAHAGKIWAESTAGNGATFFISLQVETKAVSKSLAPIGDEG